MKKMLSLLALMFWIGTAQAQPTPPAGIVIGAPVIGTCSFGFTIFNNSGIVGCQLSGGAPTGAAGGSLGGTYPNPSLAAVNSVATSFAIGGAVIGTNALAVTGTSAFAGNVTIASASLVVGAGSALTSTGAGGALGTNAFTSTTYAPLSAPTFTGTGIVTTVNTGSYGWTIRGVLTSPGAGQIQLGAANAASPVTQTLATQGSRSGTDTNVAGGNLTIQSGTGTGNATGSSLSLAAPLAVASGTGAQTQTIGLTIKAGMAVMVGYTVAALPAGTIGAIVYVTDQLTTCAAIGVAPTGGGAVVCPVFYNGVSWVSG